MASKITLKVKLNPNGTIECSWPPVSGVKEYCCYPFVLT